MKLMVLRLSGGKLLLWVMFEMIWCRNGKIMCGYLISRNGCICWFGMLLMVKMSV